MDSIRTYGTPLIHVVREYVEVDGVSWQNLDDTVHMNILPLPVVTAQNRGFSANADIDCISSKTFLNNEAAHL